MPIKSAIAAKVNADIRARLKKAGIGLSINTTADDSIQLSPEERRRRQLVNSMLKAGGMASQCYPDVGDADGDKAASFSMTPEGRRHEEIMLSLGYAKPQPKSRSMFDSIREKLKPEQRAEFDKLLAEWDQQIQDDERAYAESFLAMIRNNVQNRRDITSTGLVEEQPAIW